LTVGHGGQSDFAKSTQHEIQLISVGDTKVGKSCIIKRYCEGRFVQKYITTIGVDYGVKKVTVSGRKVAVNFFDLSGSADY
jgi:DnaJ family protein C protein 27